MRESRRTAIVIGVLFLLTHVTAIAAVALYAPVFGDPEYVLGDAGGGGILLGGLLDVVLALAVVGTSVALYPVLRRQSEGIALGYVALRTLEAGVILVGVVTILGVLSLQETAAASGDASLVAATGALVAAHNWTFLVGPGLICGTNTVLAAYLMYRSGLVPRFIAVLGLVGGPLIFAANTGVMFGVFDQVSPWTGLCVIPIFAWEICLAVYLIAKGFRSAALARLAGEPVDAVPPRVPAGV
ncbi:DUF4386 domain-containing protein [Planctomonas deserti]|uniref:DUF4386 domain-containing protein n=1 Tax=Planctomonas deserti TaxID=2144185 RepID=UPI000D3464A8|nr:DUF4386 domain-containing protein [Planctomonas deserti]